MSFRYVSAAANSSRAQHADADTSTTSSSVLVELARRDLEDGGGPTKHVSPRAYALLTLAQRAIDHTKAIIQNQGNQLPAIERTKGNSFNRLRVVRNDDYWTFTTDEAADVAARDPLAYIAAKVDIARGGNCGEHAVVAFNFLRSIAKGVKLQRCSYEGLDHAFVILGDLTQPDEFPDNELVVADPWPISPEACLWEDHFANGGDRSQINVSNARVGDGLDNKESIKAGLKLTSEGTLQLLKTPSTQQQQEMLADPGKWHLWNHEDASADTEYDYEALKQVSVHVPEGMGWGYVATQLNNLGYGVSAIYLEFLNPRLVLQPGENIISVPPTD